MKPSLLSWSRKLHRWAGIYLSLVTLLWLGEMVVLPRVFAPVAEAPSAAPAAVGPDAGKAAPPLPVEDILARFRKERAGGDALAPETATYLPDRCEWLVCERRHYLCIRYEAATGAVLERRLDGERLMQEKNGLAWLNPALGAALKFSFHPLFILLCVTGVHLLPYWSGRGAKKRDS